VHRKITARWLETRGHATEAPLEPGGAASKRTAEEDEPLYLREGEIRMGRRLPQQPGTDAAGARPGWHVRRILREAGVADGGDDRCKGRGRDGAAAVARGRWRGTTLGLACAAAIGRWRGRQGQG
jgi:hypothetical protein